MTSFAKNGQKNRNSRSLPTAEGPPKRLYLWVLVAMLLMQIYIVLSGIFRLFNYMSDKLEASPPAGYWWTLVDLQACTWLLLIPLLAAIIADRRSPAWKIALYHIALVGAVLFGSGNYLHRIAHIQSDQRQYLVKLKEASDIHAGTLELTGRLQGRIPAPMATAEQYSQKSYEEVAFHKSYGLGYWIAEFTVVLTGYLLKCMVGYAVLYFLITEYRSRQAERLQQTLTQLQHESLCNRLTPHFLFNTLNTISSLTLTDGKAARACISQLGELLRDSLECLPEGEIRLDREIEIIQTYLDIQKTRFGDKVSYSINIEEGLADAMVPAFVLQPLVENSFKHGFQGSDGIGHVDIKAKRDGDLCQLEVADDGQLNQSGQQLDEKHGLGLTRQRLSLQYGLDATVAYAPNHPRGLKVIVSVPLRVENELQEAPRNGRGI